MDLNIVVNKLVNNELTDDVAFNEFMLHELKIHTKNKGKPLLAKLSDYVDLIITGAFVQPNAEQHLKRIFNYIVNIFNGVLAQHESAINFNEVNNLVDDCVGYAIHMSGKTAEREKLVKKEKKTLAYTVLTFSVLPNAGINQSKFEIISEHKVQ